MNNAYKRVKSNKGAHGVDGMRVDELLQYLKENGDQLKQSILDGKHRPNPVRRVEIPKEDGKKTRKLGIPTVVDRVVQQAIAQVLTPIFEKQFSDNSYGFRPGRSAHDAIKKCQNNIEEGYQYVVDMDLEKYFDSVNQSKLIEVLSRTIKDGRVISLVHKYQRAGVVVRHRFEETEVGVAQGYAKLCIVICNSTIFVARTSDRNCCSSQGDPNQQDLDTHSLMPYVLILYPPWHRSYVKLNIKFIMTRKTLC